MILKQAVQTLELHTPPPCISPTPKIVFDIHIYSYNYDNLSSHKILIFSCNSSFVFQYSIFVYINWLIIFKGSSIEPSEVLIRCYLQPYHLSSKMGGDEGVDSTLLFVVRPFLPVFAEFKRSKYSILSIWIWKQCSEFFETKSLIPLSKSVFLKRFISIVNTPFFYTVGGGNRFLITDSP